MKKEIQFSAKFNTADFDRSIEQMQRKLKEMYAPSDMIRMQNQNAGRMESGGTPGIQRPGQEAFQKASMQSRREVEQFLIKEIQQQDRLSKIIEAREQRVKSLKKQQDELVKGSQEELAIKQKIAQIEDKRFRNIESYNGRDKGIKDILDKRDELSGSGIDKLRDGYASGGLKGAASAGMDAMKSMSLAGVVGVVGSVLAAVGGVAKVAGAVYANVKNSGVDIASNSGSATQGIFGREVGAAYSGKTAYEMAFLPEKQKAMKMALDSMKGQRVNNVIGALTSPFDGMVGAGVKGGLAGAAIGSVIPGIGTAVGGAVGAIGGIGYNAMSNIANDPKKLSLLGSPFSKTMDNQYEATMAKEFAGKYQQALEGLKNDNPMKTAAADEYQQNYMRNLDVQRSMGLNYDSFHGKDGFRENAINAGFTDSMAMGASGNILASGGSTRMARDSVFALQASRNLDQTNSSQVLGQLSGSIGSSEGSKQAYVKMLAEGTRQGLDSSEYREESRKFMEAAGGVVANSGTSNQDDIARLVSQFGGFLADKSQKGVEAAKGAFDTYNNMTSQTSGPRGSIRSAAMLQDPLLGSMDAKDRVTLSQIPQAQLSADDPAIKAMADKYGKSPDEIISAITGAGAKSFNLTAAGDKYQKSVLDAKKQLKSLGSEPENDEKRKSLNEEIEKNSNLYEANIAFENPSMEVRKRHSLAQGMLSDDPKERADALKNLPTDMEGKGPRPEDESVAGAAEGSRMVLENFRMFKDDLIPAAKAIQIFNEQLQKTITVISNMPAMDRNKYYEQLGLFTPAQNQSQSGKAGK